MLLIFTCMSTQDKTISKKISYISRHRLILWALGQEWGALQQFQGYKPGLPESHHSAWPSLPYVLALSSKLIAPASQKTLYPHHHFQHSPKVKWKNASLISYAHTLQSIFYSITWNNSMPMHTFDWTVFFYFKMKKHKQSHKWRPCLFSLNII